MQRYLDEVAPNIFDVDPYSGENIKKLLTRASRDFDPDYHTVIMVMGRICSIAHRDKDTNVTSLRTYDIDRATRKFKKSMRQGLSKIRNKQKEVPVVIVPTVGIDLTVYNRSLADETEQPALNATVMAVNKVIVQMNDRNMKIPWITKLVHHCRGRGKWTHRYHYLRDGCHFNKMMKKHVASELAKSLIGL